MMMSFKQLFSNVLFSSTSLLYIAAASVLSCFMIFFFISGILAFLILCSIAFALFYSIQDNFLFFPDIGLHRTCVQVPSIYSLPYETVYIKTRDKVSLHAYFIRHPEAKGNACPTIIFFHGNAGNIGGRLINASGIYNHLQCNILLVEYRGYGLSSGNPTEKGLYIDGRAAVDYLFTRHDLDHSQIILFGRSLGGAIVIDIAADPNYGTKLFACIVENTFTSIPLIARHLIPFTKYIPLLCHKNKFSSIDKIERVTTPILFISGLNDTLVPPSMMSTLHSLCKSSRKQLFQLSGGGHMDSFLISGYYQGIAQFLTECKELKGPQQTNQHCRLNLWPIIEEV
ncbi:hypothetical protein PVAND_005208 [Polypedilum vanderplanki]|uniref:Peptidase S9 prolyl oligopeptidase catalytic domain-containing protein n=1 Tax=Polypedilum vanderplanki TaxID=319348 RepID=A0A9J6C057_POLVA|nr:hypothetical protein PVAND_005208 [Polypedilum vanderplanki]